MSKVAAEPGPSKSGTQEKSKDVYVLVSTKESNKDTTKVYSEIYNTIRKSTGATSDNQDRSLPGLVLSVIGDSESYVPKSWNTTEFESGLLQTVKGAKESWIIYRGKKDGVSSLVDMAFKGSTLVDDNDKNQDNETNCRNQKVTLVAIKPCNETEDKTCKKENGRWTFQLKLRVASTSDAKNKQNPNENCLNNKKEFKWFNNYLANLLSELSRQYTPLLTNKSKVVLNMRVPVVIIAVEGDVTTVHQIQSSIQRKVPVLLVKGSGKAVDCIIEFIKETSCSEKDRILAENAALLLGIYINSEEYENLKKMMEEIEKYRYLVTIFDLHSKNGGKMEDAIVKAILKGWSLQGVHAQTSHTESPQPLTRFETWIPNDQDKLDKGIANSEKGILELNSPVKNIYDMDNMTNAKPMSPVIVPNNNEITSSTRTTPSINIIKATEDIKNVPPVLHAIVIKTNETSNEKEQKTQHSTTSNGKTGEDKNANVTNEASHGKDKTGNSSNTEEDTNAKVANETSSNGIEQTSKNSTTLNVVDKTGAEKLKTLNELYPLILTPGSLSLYFYIVYQYIKESEHLTEKDKDWQVLLLHAIIADRDDYVSSLIQHGVTFDHNNIDTLYSETLQCKNCDGIDCTKIHAIHFRVSATYCRKIWCTCINHLNETNQLCKIRGGDVIKSARQLCSILLTYSETDESKKEDMPKDESKKEDMPKDDLYHDLLAWALFANRKELAGVFWSKCKNPLLTAIMASSILKNMAKKVHTGKDRKLHEDLTQHSRLFEKRALELQNTLYDEDEKGCMSLVNTVDEIWDMSVGPIECAYENGMVDVIGHPCVQRLLSKIWYNDSAAQLPQWYKSLWCCGRGPRRFENMKKAWSSPAMTFAVHYIVVLVLLVIYSAFILMDIKSENALRGIGVYEFILHLWILLDLLEEILLRHLRSLLLHKMPKGRLVVYLKDFWKLLAWFSYIIIGAAFLVRIVSADDYKRTEIRLYSLGLFIMYMRFLKSMLVLTYFGPKIIMIGKMLKELIQFSWILFIFIMCAGVLYHSNMYPHHYDMWPSRGTGAFYWRLWKIMSLPYWQIYGELFLEDLKGENNSNGSCTFIQSEWESDPSIERCVEYDWAIMIIAAIYMLISNLLLVNLVIALFSYRFEEVQNNSDRLWKFWRYSIISDYSTRFPIPFNVPLHIIDVIRTFCCSRSTYEQRKCIKGTSLPPDLLEDFQPKHAARCLFEEMTEKKQ
ncbi:transient receptor potential cation channel subfamily M member 8-like isoform X3 [Mytilus californianus]|uniref:transient receptor potential cation channel subfamily M member 8-like isoform X3 n=1 Tax=Mytilus californianus TaxID=6549 RepID=UPI0022479DD4|nr:transient receptor potential cation channel subfamily M member 8-like isoform X3 [Mytilus californianus]